MGEPNTKKGRLKLIFLVDTEADFYYKIPSPHFSKLDMIKWRLNKIAGKYFRYPWPSRKGILNLIQVLKENKFPATFCVCGHLFLKECNGFPHFGEKAPENRWYHNKIGKNWYYWDKCGNFMKNPGLFLGDIIESNRDNKLFDFGLHAFSHEALTLESKSTVNSIVKAGVLAAESRGVKIKSFACPFELTEDEKDPNKVFDVLKENKIKRIFYAGKDLGLIKKRNMDIKKPEKDKNLEKIWISGYFEGTSNKEYLKRIIKSIKENYNKDAVYCLVTHDFTHKNTKNVRFMLNEIKKMESENLIKIIN